MLTWIYDRYRGVHDYLKRMGWHSIFVNSTALLIMFGVVLIVDPLLLEYMLKWLIFMFPVWGFFFLAPLGWWAWLRYAQTRFINKLDHIVLEIRLPQTMKQTPEAMERVFASFHIRSGQTTFLTRWMKGGVGTWWSFEMHSHEGHIRFYVWGRRPFKKLMQAFIYAQYPDIEVVEVTDPLEGLHYVRDMRVWGCEYKLAKEDVIPIKTYKDYHQEDIQSGKNIEKYSDPLDSVFERLSDIRKGEYVVIQFVIRQDRDVSAAWPNRWFWFRRGKKRWEQEAKSLIKRIYSESRLDYENMLTGEVEKGFAQLKPADAELVKALTRSIEKHAFNAVIRVAHFGRAESFQGHINSTHFSQMWRQFSSGAFNVLGTGWTYWHEQVDFPWQDPFGWKVRYNWLLLDALRRRQGFYKPYEHIYSTFTTEELATLFHFPGAQSEAPGVVRTPSRTADAPINLPM